MLGGGGTYQGRRGYDALWSAHEAIRQQMVSILRRHAAAEWLLIIRAAEYCMDDWLGHLRPLLSACTVPGTAEATRAMARSAITERHRESLVGITCLVPIADNVEVAWRRVGKGQAVIVNRHGDLSWSDPPDVPSLSDAIELFDRRRAAHKAILGATVGSVGDLGVVPSDAIDQTTAVFTSLRAQPGIPDHLISEVLTSYDPWYVTLINLERLAPAHRPESPEVTIRLFTLRTLLGACALHVRGDGGWRPGVWTRYGVIQLSWAKLMSRLRDLLKESGLNPADRRLAVQSLPEWTRDALLRIGRDVLIDLAALTGLLIDGHTRPTDGTSANSWGRACEARLQSQIDKSTWRPAGPVRQLVGKAVKRKDGSFITDIDAVADTPDGIILFDYKSYPSTEGTRRGYAAETEKRRRKVEFDAQAWQRKTAEINQNRDLLGVPQLLDRELLGVVVTTEIPFVHLGPASEVVTAGLRRVAGVAEFTEALH